MGAAGVRKLVVAMAACRVAIGVAAICLPGPASRLLGIPPEQDSATARLMGRLFGVRDIALGALAFRTWEDPATARIVYRLNACVDAGDAAAMGVALARRQGIDCAAMPSVAVALTAVAGWWYVRRRTPMPLDAAPSDERTGRRCPGTGPTGEPMR